MQRKVLCIALVLAVVLAIVLTAFSIKVQTQQNSQPQSNSKTPNTYYQKHILGGFSINTPSEATKAVLDGVQVVFKYSGIPTEGSALGQKLQSLHMKVVDGFIWSYLNYYECHRTLTIKPPPLEYTAYCQQDIHSDLVDEQALLTAIEAHLREVRKNPLIIGYWVLDDWAPWDAGSAQELLIEIHKLINYYTPGMPAICGFGGGFGLEIDSWGNVGPYIYVC